MFTGIITAKTQINHTKILKEGVEVTFKTPSDWVDLVIGESIAVNGVCLTVASLKSNEWTSLLMPETLDKTSFKEKMPDTVNLERALPLSERLSGHIVQGHTDTVGRVVDINTSNGHTISIEFPKEYSNLVIYKGSVTIDGVSLTVSSCLDNILTVSIIPHTLESTTLGILKKNDSVNIEFDVIGKYVINFLKDRNAKS